MRKFLGQLGEAIPRQFPYAATLLLLISAALSLALPETANAQIWVTSGFMVTPGAQTETAYCSTSAVNPSTGQNSQAATDYNEFFVYCTVTPSDGSATITSTQCPAGYAGRLPAGSSAGGNPTGQCSFTFQPKPGVTYTIKSKHGLQFGILTDCPAAPSGGGFAWCYVDPGGFWAYAYSPGTPTYATQSSSVTQGVTYPGPAQDIPYWGIGQYSITQDWPVASSSAKWAASCPTPNITSISPSTWIAGQTYNPVTITGTGFTTTANATSACPVNTVTVTTPDGSAVSVSGVNIASTTSITASVQPASTAPTESATVTVSGNPAATTTAQILGNQIQCDPSMNCTQPVISTVDGTNPPLQNVVVGQQIKLTTPALPSGITATSTTWTVGGTRIANYAPTTASASVTELADTDLQKSQATFYWVYPGSSIPVTYTYCVDIEGANPVNQCSLPANAAFNVTGPTGGLMSFTPFAPAVTISNLTACTDSNGYTWPGGPWMYYATGVTGLACPGEADYPAYGINFNTPTGYANDSGGSYLLVQLISSDTTTGESVGTSVAGLDTDYPYGEPPSADSPKVYLQSTATSVTRSFTANMFLMWQSSSANSIPVPLGYQTWGFSGTASCSAACGAASSWTVTTNGTPGPIGSFTPSSASQTQVLNNTLVDGYPTWTSPSN